MLPPPPRAAVAGNASADPAVATTTAVVAIVARPAKLARRNRLVAVVTLASIEEVVVARWLSPKGRSCTAPPVPEQTCSVGDFTVLNFRKPDAPPTTYVVSWFGLPNRTFVRSSKGES